MRRYCAVSLGIIIACSVAGFVAVSCDGVLTPGFNEVGLPDSLFARSVLQNHVVSEEERRHGVELILDVEAYQDLDYGFSVAIPAGWRRVVAAEPAKKADLDMLSEVGTGSAQSEDASRRVELQSLEPGYAVGFESAQRHDGDLFADYILIEILPGNSSGLFTADENQRQSVIVDGRYAWYDRLMINQASTGLTDVDLVIYQAELAGVGYTVGLYAIGEHTSEKIMAIAFEVMLQTFQIERPPFPIS